MKKSLLMITPETEEIRRFRRRQFNNFTQITMPYLAGFQGFRSRFHGLPSLLRRMAVSRTNPGYTLLLNLGYRLSI
jgi:hypothetical protein